MKKHIQYSPTIVMKGILQGLYQGQDEQREKYLLHKKHCVRQHRVCNIGKCKCDAPKSVHT